MIPETVSEQWASPQGIFHLNRLTTPSPELLNLAQAKQHLRIDTGYTDDDSYISLLITIAREYCEDYSHRGIGVSDYEFVIDSFPLNKNFIELPVTPLISVAYVKSIDAWNNTVVMNTSDYLVDIDRYPGAVFLPFSNIWPVVIPQAGVAVRIKFTAGHALADVPNRIIQAMLLLVGHWYNNREEATDVRKNQIPLGVDALLGQIKVW